MSKLALSKLHLDLSCYAVAIKFYALVVLHSLSMACNFCYTYLICQSKSGWILLQLQVLLVMDSHVTDLDWIIAHCALLLCACHCVHATVCM